METGHFEESNKAYTHGLNGDSVEHTKPNAKYVCFAEAREFARSLKLKSRKEWRAYVKGELEGLKGMPLDVPAHPDGIYKVKGWQGWKNWLGTSESEFLH